MRGFLSSFLHLFQLLNNWPRAILYVWEESGAGETRPLLLTISRPVFESSRFANSLEDLREVYGKVEVSVCGDNSLNDKGEFEWTASLYNHVVKQWTTAHCKSSFLSPHQGEYGVSVRAVKKDNTTGMGFARITVRDIWLAAVGDSFASGEGNPDRERDNDTTAQWLNYPCHRSRKSWPYEVYEGMRKRNPEAAVHFTFLACTGATVEKGLLGPTGKGQLQVLEEIARERGMGPDVLMLSVGGNDMGYAEILERLQEGDSKSILSFIDWRFFYVSNQLKAVKEAVQRLHPSQVLLPLYFDFSRNERGEVDASCDDLNMMSTIDVVMAEKRVLSRLNSLLLTIGREAGWTVEERVPSLFRNGGICSKHRLIRSLRDSLHIQGDPLGAFHPTDEAHSQIASLLLSRLNPL